MTKKKPYYVLTNLPIRIPVTQTALGVFLFYYFHVSVVICAIVGTIWVLWLGILITFKLDKEKRVKLKSSFFEQNSEEENYDN